VDLVSKFSREIPAKDRSGPLWPLFWAVIAVMAPGRVIAAREQVFAFLTVDFAAAIFSD